MAFLFLALCLLFSFVVFFYNGHINTNKAWVIRNTVSLFYLKLTLTFLALAGEMDVLSNYSRYSQNCRIDDQFIYWHISLIVIFILGAFEFFRRVYSNQIDFHWRKSETLSNMFILLVCVIGVVFITADFFKIDFFETIRTFVIKFFGFLSYHLIPTEDVCRVTTENVQRFRR